MGLSSRSSGRTGCSSKNGSVGSAGWGEKFTADYDLPNETAYAETCAAIGLVKFDLLGLGMLSALKYAFDFVRETQGIELTLHGLPQEDPRVYDLLCAGDTVGVFQVESRAQMATLPRLQPRCFYDIVVEVALIRPGPIQGGSVHPYINRARGREPVTYLHPLLEPALSKTLGVPLFQEQLMQMAMDACGFDGSAADQLRRAMGSKRSPERMEALRGRAMEGMAEKNSSPSSALICRTSAMVLPL